MKLKLFSPQDTDKNSYRIREMRGYRVVRVTGDTEEEIGIFAYAEDAALFAFVKNERSGS